MNDPFTDKLPPATVKLCEAVFDLAFDLGHTAGYQGFLELDSRALFQIVLSHAAQFELWFVEGQDDYLSCISEESDRLIEDLYETYSTFGNKEGRAT